MTEREVLDIIETEWRAQGLPAINRDSKEAMALRRAAMRIASSTDTDQRRAARTASIVGFSITRGRTHL